MAETSYFMVDWNLYWIPAIHQLCPEYNRLHRKLNTKPMNYCGWLYKNQQIKYSNHGNTLIALSGFLHCGLDNWMEPTIYSSAEGMLWHFFGWTEFYSGPDDVKETMLLCVHLFFWGIDRTSNRWASVV